jgi:hypothetical protein
LKWLKASNIAVDTGRNYKTDCKWQSQFVIPWLFAGPGRLPGEVFLPLNERNFMINTTYSWMGGQRWIWAVLAVLVIVVVVMKKLFKKK